MKALGHNNARIQNDLKEEFISIDTENAKRIKNKGIDKYELHKYLRKGLDILLENLVDKF